MSLAKLTRKFSILSTCPISKIKYVKSINSDLLKLSDSRKEITKPNFTLKSSKSSEESAQENEESDIKIEHICDSLSCTKRLKSVKVGILNADERAGQVLSFQLKQHPLIKKILLYGPECEELATDLDQIDTSCSVVGYKDEECIPDCLRSADIVVMLDVDHPDDDAGSRFENVACRVATLAKTCAKFCPLAIIVSCVQPICCTVPLIQAMFQQTPLHHPGRIVGCVAPLQSRLNSLIANYLELDPTYVQVPLVGGTDYSSVVPLMSSIDPDPRLTDDQIDDLYHMILKEKTMCEHLTDYENRNFLSDGYSIAQFVITIAKGLCGEKHSIAPALLRTNVIKDLDYLVTTAKFGDKGVVHNYGLPKMTRRELAQFEKCILLLQERHSLVDKYIQRNIRHHSKIDHEN